jgi:hypothetical protein
MRGEALRFKSRDLIRDDVLPRSVRPGGERDFYPDAWPHAGDHALVRDLAQAESVRPGYWPGDERGVHDARSG